MKTAATVTVLILWLSGCTATTKPTATSGEGGAARGTDVALVSSTLAPEIIETKSGLRYEVIRRGSGPAPTTRDTVHVLYKGFLLGKPGVIDSNSKDKVPDRVRLSTVIAGWQEGIQLMSVGSIFRFYIPPALAYGEKGAGSIGPNQTLVYEIELVTIDGSGDVR